MKADRKWKVKASLIPSQRGTQGAYDRFGDDLICVRYRYSPDGRFRVKTAEIVLEMKKITNTFKCRVHGTYEASKRKCPQCRIV